MQFPASQIALLINGKIEGPPEAVVTSFGKIEEAKEGPVSYTHLTLPTSDLV